MKNKVEGANICNVFIISNPITNNCSHNDNILFYCVATYFQLGKPVMGKRNQIVTNCVVSLVANKEKLTTCYSCNYIHAYEVALEL